MKDMKLTVGDTTVWEGVTISPTEAVHALRWMPSADAVEVVRCKECKWWDKEDVQPDGRRRCELLDNIRFEPEFWCAYGERKDDGNND